MSARLKLAQVLADAIGDQFHDNGEYIRIDSLTEVCLDGYADLTGVADRIIAAGYAKEEKSGAIRDRDYWEARTETAEALLKEIRNLAARNLAQPALTHYELRALLERNPA